MTDSKDALYYDQENAIVFAFSIEKGWKGKFERDFQSAIQHKLIFNTFIFGSNQRIPSTERDKIITEKGAQNINVEFYDAGRIKVLLDNHYKKARQIYLGILDNTTMRRKITNALFDPDNEVKMPARWSMFAIAVPTDMIGVFTLIKDEDLTVVCETEEELIALKVLLNNLMHYRKLTTVIDNHIYKAIAKKYLINMPSYYHKALEYCNARLQGVDKSLVEIQVTTAGYMNPTNEFCEKLYESFLEDLELKPLLEKLEAIHQACLNVRERILLLEGFRIDEK